jgi:serine/threonine protein kinase
MGPLTVYQNSGDFGSDYIGLERRKAFAEGGQAQYHRFGNIGLKVSTGDGLDLLRAQLDALLLDEFDHEGIIKPSHLGIIPFNGGQAVAIETAHERGTLETALKTAELELRDIAKLIGQASDAVAYVHSRGVIHLDIKPDNILLDKNTGAAKLTDFGFARVLEENNLKNEESARLGKEIREYEQGWDVAIGTPAFMGPEQTKGVRNEKNTDVYALGAKGIRALLDIYYNLIINQMAPEDIRSEEGSLLLVHKMQNYNNNRRNPFFFRDFGRLFTAAWGADAIRALGEAYTGLRGAYLSALDTDPSQRLLPGSFADAHFEVVEKAGSSQIRRNTLLDLKPIDETGDTVKVYVGDGETLKKTMKL